MFIMLEYAKCNKRRNDPQKESINIKIFPQTKLNWSSAIQFHSICLTFFSFYHFPLYHHHYHHHSAAHSRLRKPSLVYHNDWNICIQNDFVSVLIPPVSFFLSLSIYLSLNLYLLFKEYSTRKYILPVCIKKDLPIILLQY